jgi:4,5-DOPA dioxygenase extradiol
MARMPVLFVSHGSPMSGIEDDPYTRSLERLGKTLPRPEAIVVLSAHWEAAPPVRVTGSALPGLIYDFGGFPAELYSLSYPARGDPQLAGELAQALSATLDHTRGFDHGVWIPLRRLFPAADIPVVAVSLARGASPMEFTDVGKALAPFRDRGVLVIGSGGVVHNLRRVHFGDKAAPLESWAQEFDAWVWAQAQEKSHAPLLDYARQAPFANLAVPTPEHFNPLFVALGASSPGDRPQSVYDGFQYGNLSLRTFTIG